MKSVVQTAPTASRSTRKPIPGRPAAATRQAGKYIPLPALLTLLMFLMFLATTAIPTIGQPAPPKPIEIKVVVVSMFEIGADTGDVPGEYQYWVERQHLTQVLPFPQGYHDLRLNPQTGVLGLLTGMGTARATASVMALGLDPRFDLSHAYWLVAGIAGIDPHVGS
jgi:purine nucleoside permease